MGFTRVFSVVLALTAIAAAGGAFARGAAISTERFTGEVRIATQSPSPIHIELRRLGDAVAGTISIPGGSFELFDAKGGDAIAGRFRGEGGGGAITMSVHGDELTGAFDFAGQPGAITARRRSEDAATFFRPPEQRLDLTTGQWLEDLDRLAEILKREHGSPFHRVSPERFEREVSRVRAAIPGLDGVAVAVEFRRLGALIGDGHTSVERPQGRARLPIEFYGFEDGLRVVGVSATHRRLLGARLIAVNDVSVGDLTERLRAYVAQGETQGFHRAALPGLMNDPDVLRAVAPEGGLSFAFTFETDDGHQHAELIPTEGEAWVTLGGGQPLWKRNKGQGFWSERLADGDVYVNWRAYDGLAAHAETLLQGLEAQPPRRLILDLRDNGGGDYIVGRRFVEAISSRPWLNRDGVLYLMIGRGTFSAAMTNAVDFRRTTRAILIGEPAGAAPNNWQEVRQFHLPNSGLRVSVSTRRYEFLPGAPELLPDRQAPPQPSDWGSVLDAGVRLALAQPAPDPAP